ncbi:family 16 glycosylhydrolase [Granulosicoccus sp. 3-233]|uniref:family 16 glycosylhydrolase n=1 Tax=Granulosicoccus sp. 3-233 TaxID=3417969 RepID=UPI003D32AE99
MKYMNISMQNYIDRLNRGVSSLLGCAVLVITLAGCSENTDSRPSLSAANPELSEAASGGETSQDLLSDASSSSTQATAGFEGEVIGENIRIRWKKDSDATGYNVYRQGEYHATVFTNSFLDKDIHARDYSYHITAFEKNGQDTRYYTIARGLVVSVKPSSASSGYFRSAVTSGFVGEVLDTGVLVSWTADVGATGYNVYRQGKYHATVFETEFHDAGVSDGNYTYEIIAFDKSRRPTRYYPIAEELHVSVSAQGGQSLNAGSTATEQFVGTRQGDNIVISWKKDSGATGYNVYRDGEYHATVFETEFKDSNVAARDYAYEITAFDKSGRETRFYKIAEGLTVSAGAAVEADSGGTSNKSVVAENDNGQHFKSLTTPGFVGEVLDDSIRISWKKDPDARGYNVYRQAEYYTTVFSTEFHDTDVYDQDYYYEIQAFDHGMNGADVRYYYIATGLTVSARTLGRTDPNRPKANDELLKDYELVFADEFNGSSLDTSKWNTSFLWGTDLIINNEEQYYVDIANEPDFGFNPFSFDGNNLIINTIKTPPALAGKSLGQPYLSGIITSYDAFKFTYGYAEARVKMTHGRGYWPAFWLLNAYYGGADPEIDIMEFIGDNQDVVYHTFHYHDENGKLRSTQSQPTPGIDYTADFHTFAAEWKPGSIIFFVDGIEVHRITDPEVPTQQMYLLANTAVGGWWAGSPDDTTTFPGKYMIDYIRVYQKASLFSDAMLDDGMSSGLSGGESAIPYADDIPGQASPNHRPTREQWPEGYPYD